MKKIKKINYKSNIIALVLISIFLFSNIIFSEGMRFQDDDANSKELSENQILITPKASTDLAVFVDPESAIKVYGNSQTFEYDLYGTLGMNYGEWWIKIDGGSWVSQGAWSLHWSNNHQCYITTEYYPTSTSLPIGIHYVHARFYHEDCGYEYEDATIEITGIPPPPPDPPENVNTNENPCYDGTVIITWTRSSGATKYQLYESTSSSGTYTAIGPQLGDDSSTSVPKTSEQTRYYKVKAGNTGGWSALSTSYAQVTWSKPPTPSLTSPITQTVYTQSSFSVTRSSVGSYVNGFDWEVSIDGGTYTDWSTSSLNPLSYNPPAGDHTYRFRLRVRNTNFGVWSDYGYSGIITVSTPSTPLNFQVSEETCYDGSVTFSWTATTGAASYTLYEATTSDGTYNPIISGILDTAIPLQKYAEDTLYYKLKAVNDVGDSDFTGFIEVTWLAPESPTITSPTTQTVYTHSSFSVTRDSVGSYVDEFDWEISIDGAAYTDWSTSSVDTLSYDPSEGDHTYQFRLRVRNINFGVWSNYGYSGIITITTPSIPLNVQTSESICYDGSVIISWDAVTGATSYTLYEATTFDGEYTAIITDIMETSIIVSKTTNETRYYKVKAINEVGESDFSDYVAVSWSAPESPTITLPITQTVDDHSSFWVTRDSVGSYVDEFDWEISIDGAAYVNWSTSELNNLSYDPANENHSYQFRLRVRNSEFGVWSDYGYSGILTIILSDTISPLIDSPADVTYIYDTTGHNITWSVSDSNPYQYQLFIDGVGQGVNSWDGSDLTFNIDGLSIGTHNVTLWVRDIEGNSAQDQVDVTVENEFNISGYAIGSLSVIFLIGVIVTIFTIKRKR